MKDNAKSRQLFVEAQQLLPGGVNSPVRAFGAVGGNPVFIESGQGAYLRDVDGNRYIDYVLSWGPLILGHSHKAIVQALSKALERGTSYGAPTEQETELARLVMEFMPGIEMIRFVTSGTEATMSAIRLARAFTSRDKIIKFEGCYHGHADAFLVKAGSGVATFDLPDSPGVPRAAVQDTLLARYNDLDSVHEIFKSNPDQIAAVIVEPVAGNMGVIPPRDGFLQGLRDFTTASGALLIFDEVMTGFRVHPGGAQTLYGIEPDLTTLGKVIGGGLPVGAYGGRHEIMEMVAPIGPVYQAGTLAGNPLAMTAGIETLKLLKQSELWKTMEKNAQILHDGLRRFARRAGVPLENTRVGTMFGFFFTEGPVQDWQTARASDTKRYAAFFHRMLERGIYLAPSQFESAFVSTAHGTNEIELTLEAARESFQTLT
ncbi:MAG: glutamate-1-semialdehyde 2,1-aminomutase [Chloroflexi bacterium]|nr:glutamate-1-semialdehyde 2,1-aminomutase [Chloroflexota bacterium]